MTPETIVERLIAATDVLDEIAGYYTGDAEISAEIATVADNLHAMRLQIERDQLLPVAA